jgi:Zn-finger nucleic acid-binding protein
MTEPSSPITPTACPSCHSDLIKGPDQMAKGLSYWRCLKCGGVWNPERPPDNVAANKHSNHSNNRPPRRSDLDDYFKNR